MFVTLFYAILDPQERRLTFVNAGHNPPLLFSSGIPGVSLLNAKGRAPGIKDEGELEPVEVTLSPGDVVVLYTDGVTEAASEHDEEYGIGRLSARVEAAKGLPAKEIISAIVQDVRRCTGKRPQFDDITLMVLKVTGGGYFSRSFGRDIPDMYQRFMLIQGETLPNHMIGA